MISHRCMRCRAYPMGWCEYDFATDTVYPMDESICKEQEDREMTINEYQALAMRTAEEKGRTWGNVGLGIAGEAGEVADIVKKHLYQGHPLDHDKLLEEAGDVAWYLALAATVAGVTLESVLVANIAKLTGRYPDGFEPEKSIHREV